ncbi:MAG: Bifunctional protein FolC: Folylpolyglutamate synthase and Dihydrofolate synthase [Pseudomonadota bacterium]
MNDHPVLAELAQAGMRLGLPRMRSFLAWLGDPHLRYPVIHVAGTNGKGSVTRMVAAMLEAHGLRVGVTTSPHLQHVNERIRIGRTPIPDAELDALLTRLQREVRAWVAAEPPEDPAEAAVPLTWFEASVAAAFLHFADARVDVAVVEVGLGGRLDATNVVAPVATAVVTVGLDHTEQLGPDHASIAAEKAGVFKPGVPAVVGPVPHAALAVLRAVAAQVGAPFSAFGDTFDAGGVAVDFAYRGPGVAREGLALSLEGDHQVANAAVALRLVDVLPAHLRPSEPAIRAGLRLARNRGRLERLAPDLVVDGAHNADGAAVLAAWLAARPRAHRVLVLGAGGDKDVRAVVLALAPHVDEILTTRCAHPRARDPEALAGAVRDAVGGGLPVRAAGAVEHALPLARSRAEERGGEVIVAGSLFLVGAVRDLLGLD